ncbi:hypothetical protein FOL47_007729 [Perkinsus chesapeaki]|uniref:Uncharacterized protein n=1 Tax=Perkinsus chesapeaki TaxID=330153 RepID=A0A7J6LJ64_PERCH|nr:hypothetical protein FOL47_007729 [Perkinsus chesapeaki]
MFPVLSHYLWLLVAVAAQGEVINMTDAASAAGLIEMLLSKVFERITEVNASCVEGRDCLLSLPPDFGQLQSSLYLSLVDDVTFCGAPGEYENYLAELLLDEELPEDTGDLWYRYRMDFADPSGPRVGSYKICICLQLFSPCVRPLEYAMSLGRAWVQGPLLGRPGLVECHADEAVCIVDGIQAEGLRSDTSIDIVKTEEDCKSAIPLPFATVILTVEATTGVGSIVLDEQLLEWLPARTYKLCYGGMEEVAVASVELRNNKSVECDAIDDCLVPIEGFLVGLDTGIRLVEPRADCLASGADSLSPHGSLMRPRSQDIRLLPGQVPGGQYEVCRCSPPCDDNTAHKLPLMISMRGPRLASGGDSVVCYKGLPCSIKTTDIKVDDAAKGDAIRFSNDGCGQRIVEPRAIPGSILGEGDASTLTFPAMVDTPGLLSICYCMASSAGGCNGPQSFSLPLGILKIRGPLDGANNFTCSPIGPCTVRLEGMGIERGDRLRAIEGDQCGADVKTFYEAGVGDNSTAVLETVPRAAGVYATCLCLRSHTGQCSSWEDFAFPLGSLTVQGLTNEQEYERNWTCVTSQECIVDFEGGALSMDGFAKAKLLNESCDVVTSGLFSTDPGRIVVASSERQLVSFGIYAGEVIPYRGQRNLSVCYCFGQGRCMPVPGTLVVRAEPGPLEASPARDISIDQELECRAGVPCTLRIEGFGLTWGHRVVMYDRVYGTNCSSLATDSRAMLTRVAGMLVKESPEAVFSVGVVKTPSVYTTCFCLGKGPCEDWGEYDRGYGITVHVRGAYIDQRHVVCGVAYEDGCNFTIQGYRLTQYDKVKLVTFDQECPGDRLIPDINSGRLVDVSVDSSSTYANLAQVSLDSSAFWRGIQLSICYCSGGEGRPCQPTRDEDFVTAAGSLTVYGPARAYSVWSCSVTVYTAQSETGKCIIDVRSFSKKATASRVVVLRASSEGEMPPSCGDHNSTAHDRWRGRKDAPIEVAYFGDEEHTSNFDLGYPYVSKRANKSSEAGDLFQVVGSYGICICLGDCPRGTPTADNYSVPLGRIDVLGPSAGQVFSCTQARDCSISIKGYGLSKEDKLVLLTGASPGQCGVPRGPDEVDEEEVIPVKQADGEGRWITAVVQRTSLPQIGTFTLCWCSAVIHYKTGCDTLSKFTGFSGALNVIGPLLNQDHVCVLGQPCNILINGYQLSPIDKLALKTTPFCANSTALALSAFPSQPYGVTQIQLTSAQASTGFHLSFPAQPGSFSLCYCTSPGTLCGGGGAVETLVGNLTVNGVYGNQSPTLGSFLNPYRFGVLGTYTVCVCASFATDPRMLAEREQQNDRCLYADQFNVKAGIVRSIGIDQTSNDSVICGAMDANCIFNYTGASFGLSRRDRVTIAVGDSCSNLPQAAVRTSLPVSLYQGRSVAWGVVIPPRAMPRGGNYTVCYCAAGLDDSDCVIEASYHLRAGDLIVSGSVEQGVNHSCVPGETCTVSIDGVGLDSRDRLKVLNSADRPCTNIVVEAFGDMIVNASAITDNEQMAIFVLPSFASADVFVLCYCPFTGLPDWVENPCLARSPHKIGRLHVEGFKPSSGEYHTALGRYKGTATLPVTMIGQPTRGWKIEVRPVSRQCNSSIGSDEVFMVSDVDPRGEGTLVVDVSQLPEGKYRACGCTGSCHENGDAGALVDLGEIDVISPTLNIAKEGNSTDPFLPCAAGQLCEVTGVGDIEGADIFLTTVSVPSGATTNYASTSQEDDTICGASEDSVVEKPVGREPDGSFVLKQFGFGSVRAICACMRIAFSLDGWNCTKPEHFNIAIGGMIISGPLRSSVVLRCPIQSDCRVEIEGILLTEGDQAVLLAEGSCGDGSSKPLGNPSEILLNEDRSVGEFDFGKSGSSTKTLQLCYCHDANADGCGTMEQFTLAAGPLDVYFRLNAFHILGIIGGCLVLALILRYVCVRLRRRRFATGAHQLDFDKTGNAKIGYEYTTEVGGIRGGRTKTRVIWRPQDQDAAKAALETLRQQLPERVEEPIEDDEDLGEDDDIFHVPEDEEDGANMQQKYHDLNGSSIRRSAMKVPRARTGIEAWEEVEGPLGEDDDTRMEFMRTGSGSNNSYSRASLHRRPHRSPRTSGHQVTRKVYPGDRQPFHQSEDTESVCGTTAPHTPEEPKKTEGL